MPIFEYKCDDCGSRFEKLIRRAGDETGMLCPSCGQARVAKQLSTFAAHAGSPSSERVPMCPSGGPCPTPGACGLN
ncbi:MAG: zinc ribbon domain-containing protein [Acidobacteria bacterium]|nr:zinc ribbon domain-containing protein [Acidobacteriota bacterium]